MKSNEIELIISHWSKQERKNNTLRCLIYGGRYSGKSTKAEKIMKTFSDDITFKDGGKRVFLFNSFTLGEDEAYRMGCADFTYDNLDVGKTWLIEDIGDVFVFDGFNMDKLLDHPLFLSVLKTEKNHIIVIPNDDSKSSFNDFSIFEEPYDFNTLVITNNSLCPKKRNRCEQCLRQYGISLDSFRSVYEILSVSDMKESLVILFSYVAETNVKVGEYRWAFEKKG